MMAKESTALLKKEGSLGNVFSCFSEVYQQSYFHSIRALLVLLWAVSVLIAMYMLIYSFFCLPMNTTNFIIWDGIQITVFIFFPVLGYLGEKYLRYRLLLVGVFMIAVSCILSMVLTALILATSSSGSDLQFYLCISYVVALIPGMCGYGLFIANVTQFGASQLQFAPSTDFAAFARWSIFVFIFGWTLPQFLTVLFPSSYISNLWLLLPQLVCFSVMIVATLIIACFLRRHVIIEYPSYSDPVKQIWQVLRYSWKHKYPLKRGAFTYSDGYVSRIDVGKNRYGGPFTMEQVEHVKSFFRILTILVCHCMLPIFCASTLAEWYNRNSENSSFSQNLLKFPTAIVGLVALVCIVVFQFIVVPYFPRLVLGILKRILVGMVFYLLAAASTVVIRINLSTDLIADAVNDSQFKENCTNNYVNKSWPYYLIAIPVLLTGLAIFFNLTSQLEFIFAQAPYNMKGILIGILQCELGFPMFIDFVGVFTQAANYWEYFLGITFLTLILLITCTLAVYCYKYRQGNEPSDINVRATIEEIYERDLNRVDEDDQSDE